MSYEDYVCGTKFRDMADVILGQHGKIDWNVRYHFPPDKLIVYCHTHDFRYIVDIIAKIHSRVILVTHNSDGGVKDSKIGQVIGENDADASLLPANVVKWYAQNVELGPEYYDKIVPIPIGLENSYCFPYDKARMLFNKNTDEREPLPGGRFIYFNCNLRTNYAERSEALKHASGNGYVTVQEGMNGHNYDGFLDDILAHKAVISPRGNGLDCHRTWETLYLRRVPIMKYTPSLYNMRLPILWLQSWDQLKNTQAIIDAVDMFKYDIAANIGMGKLSMKYWIKRIRNAE